MPEAAETTRIKAEEEAEEVVPPRVVEVGRLEMVAGCLRGVHGAVYVGGWSG